MKEVTKNTQKIQMQLEIVTVAMYCNMCVFTVCYCYLVFRPQGWVIRPQGCKITWLVKPPVAMPLILHCNRHAQAKIEVDKPDHSIPDSAFSCCDHDLWPCDPDPKQM